MRTPRHPATLTALLFTTLGAQANLQVRPGGMVYDSARGITWLQDWNYASAKMDWAKAMAWAGAMTHGGFDDWRLPSALNADGSGPCDGAGCAGSEMGQVWSLLAGDAGPFIHLQRDDYWSGTEDVSDSANAWSFSTVDAGGYQESTSRTYEFFAVAVRNGDVITATPEPQALALVLLALGAAGAAARHGGRPERRSRRARR